MEVESPSLALSSKFQNFPVCFLQLFTSVLSDKVLASHMGLWSP